MRRLDLLRPGQTRNRPGQLENAVVNPGAQLHLAHRRFEQICAGFINRAEVVG